MVRKKISMIITNPDVLPEPFDDNFLTLLDNAGLDATNWEEEDLETYYAWVGDVGGYHMLDTGLNATSEEDAVKAYLELVQAQMEEDDYEVLLTSTLEEQLDMIKAQGYQLEASDVPFEVEA